MGREPLQPSAGFGEGLRFLMLSASDEPQRFNDMRLHAFRRSPKVRSGGKHGERRLYAPN